MATIHRIAFWMLILQLYVTAAPSDISKFEDITEDDEANIKPDSETYGIKAEANDNSTQSARQKRFYNYYGYGFPPISPIIYPNNAKRDQSSDTTFYGADDPFVQIHRRLQEIANLVKHPVPPPPPPPSHVPLFFPVIFIPQVGCDCFPEGNNSTPQKPTDNKNITNPDVFIRLPDLQDNDQSILNNETEAEYDEEDFVRPISFDPISVNRPLTRPPPPVEHGSSQGNNPTQSTTTIEPVTKPALALETNSNELSNAPELPNSCDGAILSCCHQLHVTYDCFALQGCPDQTSYGNNPCDFNVILRVINRFQRFYGQSKG